SSKQFKWRTLPRTNTRWFEKWKDEKYKSAEGERSFVFDRRTKIKSSSYAAAGSNNSSSSAILTRAVVVDVTRASSPPQVADELTTTTETSTTTAAADLNHSKLE